MAIQSKAREDKPPAPSPHDAAVQTLNQILKPEVEDQLEQLREKLNQEPEPRPVAVGAAHFAGEASRLKQENQLLRQKV